MQNQAGSTSDRLGDRPVDRDRLVGHPCAIVKVSCILKTCPCCNNLEFDIFDAGGPQCHFITSFTTAVRIRTLSVYQFKLNLVC